MRRIYLGTFVAAWMSQLLTPVFALNDTIGVTAGSGKTANLIKFGSNNVISEVGICDATTENQCVAVSAGGALSAAVTGSVTANAGTNLNTSALALETGGNLATLAGAISTARMQTNLSQIAGTTTATGNGLVGAGGVQRVAIASDNSAIPVTATVTGAVTANAGTNLNTSALALETGGNLATLAGAITSTRMQANVSQINGVTPLMGNGGTGTGSQRVTIASDNTPFTVNVAQATSSSLKGQVDPLTAASWALGAFGVAMPANGQGIGLYDGTNMVRAKGDETSGIWVNIKAGAGSGGTALADEASFTIGTTNTTPAACSYNTGSINLTSGQSGVIRCTNDRQQLVSDAALLAAAQAGTIVDNAAFTQGTTSVIMIGCEYNTSITNLTSGNGGAPQCTNDRKVVTASFNGGSTYNTVAASQTAQSLTGGGGGATGDYLSHCDVFPTSTTPGVVTIIDNSTTIFPFPGGASSVSNLVPFAIPIGAKSTSGAWKVTTGANVSVTCVGKFT